MSAARESLVEHSATACLLALVALDASALDPFGCAQECLEQLVGLGPVVGARLDLELPGWPTVTLEVGRAVPLGPGATAAQAADVVAAVVTVEAAPVGRLSVVPLAGVDADFVAGAAVQIGTVLAGSVQADGERRRTAAADALRAAGALDPDDPARALERLADYLAAFPDTASAELIVDHPALGVPVVAGAGFELEGDRATTWVSTRELGGGLAVVRRTGIPGPQVGDKATVDEVLARLEQTLAHLEAQDARARASASDPVTGLGNRARFDVELERAVVRAARRCEAVAVIVLELRGFEAIAESLGPEVSDLVLRACARVLRSGSYGYAPAFRLDAGELAVVVPGADVLTALAMAEQMHSELPAAAATVLPPGAALPVAAGIAVFPDSAPDRAGVLEAARSARSAATGDGPRAIRVAPFADSLEDVLPARAGERRRRARLRRVERR